MSPSPNSSSPGLCICGAIGYSARQMRALGLLLTAACLACDTTTQVGYVDGGAPASASTSSGGTTTGPSTSAASGTSIGTTTSGATSQGTSGASTSTGTTTGATSGVAATSSSGSSGGTSGAEPNPDGGSVSTLAGNGNAGLNEGTGGPDGTAEFSSPMGVAVDSSGNVYVADTGNVEIRKIAPDGTVSSFAGNGLVGWIDGPPSQAEFTNPTGITLGPDGNLYVADEAGLRKVDLSGNVSTVAGGVGNDAGQEIEAVGPFEDLQAVAMDHNGNLYASDQLTLSIWKIDASGNITVLAGNGNQGDIDGTGGDGGTAEFRSPDGLAVDSRGNVYVADAENQRIRKIDPSGNVSTWAGNGGPSFSDGTGGPNGMASFEEPNGLAVDAFDNLYVADTDDARIRRIDSQGNVTTVAGDGNMSFMDGSGGPNGTAEFDLPYGVAVDAAGDVFVADEGNNDVRVFRP